MLIDTARLPMSLYGALTALLIFGIFLGTWWFYGMRGRENPSQ